MAKPKEANQVIIEKNGIKAFGLFMGLPYGKICNQDYKVYLKYHNTLPREVIRNRICSLEIAYCPMGSPRDEFMGIDLDYVGTYHDGPFSFPIDFLRYFDTFGIGIPPEYEKYLIETVGLK